MVMRSDLTTASTQKRKISLLPNASLTRICIPLLVVGALGCETTVGNPGGGTPGSGGGTTSQGGGGGSSGKGGGQGGTTANGGSSGATPGTGGSSMTECIPQGAPRAPLRRLTRFEYNNTVRDLLRVTTRPADVLPGESLGTGFGNDADDLSTSHQLADGYRTIAQQIALEVTGSATAVATVTGCDPAATGEDACRQQFLTSYLGRAFRRPATAEELTAYEAAFAQGKMLGGDFASGVRAVLERSLQSAQFLYRPEFGEPVDAAQNLARPTAYEMATRLSYLIWGSMPDPALFEAAQQGKLATKEGVRAEAERLLAHDNAKESLRYFHTMLFGTGGLDNIERDATTFPSFKPGMGKLFRQETEMFLDDIVWNGAGDLATVFSAPFTFVNGPLATFYGIPNVTGDAFQKVPIDTTRRSGLLTQASILTLTTPGTRTDPVVRGKWIFTKILCGTIQDPPLDVPELPDPIPGQSVRERLAAHREADECKGCHALMDPLGFAFEHFDGVGQWRDTENGAPIDASGEVPDEFDVAGPFNGVVELAQKVAQSQDVRSCYAGRYLNFAYGRAISQADACSRAAVENAFEQAQGNVKQLMLAVTQTDGFLLRPLATP
jgi:hypothetical protein